VDQSKGSETAMLLLLMMIETIDIFAMPVL
jgi:hypothetical protein